MELLHKLWLSSGVKVVAFWLLGGWHLWILALLWTSYGWFPVTLWRRGWVSVSFWVLVWLTFGKMHLGQLCGPCGMWVKLKAKNSARSGPEPIWYLIQQEGFNIHLKTFLTSSVTFFLIVMGDIMKNIYWLSWWIGLNQALDMGYTGSGVQ